RRLRRAHPRHFLHVGSHYTALPLAQLAVVLDLQHALHPGVFLVPSAPRKLDPLARLEKLPDLFPAQALGIPHAHLHPAAPRLPRSSRFHAHLALETAQPASPVSYSSCIG